jgi:hypothetical protein
MKIVILVLLILLNVIGLALTFQRNQKTVRVDSIGRSNLVLVLIIGFWLGVVFASLRPTFVGVILKEWWIHVGLSLTALGFGIASKNRIKGG